MMRRHGPGRRAVHAQRRRHRRRSSVTVSRRPRASASHAGCAHALLDCGDVRRRRRARRRPSARRRRSRAPPRARAAAAAPARPRARERDGDAAVRERGRIAPAAETRAAASAAFGEPDAVRDGPARRFARGIDGMTRAAASRSRSASAATCRRPRPVGRRSRTMRPAATASGRVASASGMRGADEPRVGPRRDERDAVGGEVRVQRSDERGRVGRARGRAPRPARRTSSCPASSVTGSAASQYASPVSTPSAAARIGASGQSSLRAMP